MKLLRALASLLAGMMAATAFAETWELMSGERVEGKLSGVYGPIVVIADKSASRIVPMTELKDVELGRVADFLAAKSGNALPWTGSTSKVAKALKGRLHVLRGEKLVDFDPGARPEPEFYLVYFGAEWCPPCRTFSPKLVSAYERLKRLAPEKFEVVFVSSDRDAREQLSYVRHVNMPWPLLKFSQIGRAEAIERWAGKGIPCLVALTRDGDALFHSYHGTEYVGPMDVLQRFEQLLHALRGEGEQMKRMMHRLAVLQHVRAAGTEAKPVQPYLVALDFSRYQTLEVKEVTAMLDIDEKGQVLDAAIDPELPVVLNYQLVKDAGTWLFLPMVENGQPQRRKVKLPLMLRQ